MIYVGSKLTDGGLIYIYRCKECNSAWYREQDKGKYRRLQ